MAAAAPRRGYALVVALILVAMVSLAATIVLASRSADALREKERELLWVGGQYREALRSYVDATPAGHAQRFPRSLTDLVADNRGPITKRHLRRIYPDPMTGHADWELEGSPGVITGLHSASQDLPLQRAGFGPGEEEFARATSYAEWRFFYAPPAAAAWRESGLRAHQRSTPDRPGNLLRPVRASLALLHREPAAPGNERSELPQSLQAAVQRLHGFRGRLKGFPPAFQVFFPLDDRPLSTWILSDPWDRRIFRRTHVRKKFPRAISPKGLVSSRHVTLQFTQRP